MENIKFRIDNAIGYNIKNSLNESFNIRRISFFNSALSIDVEIIVWIPFINNYKNAKYK
jgi:hypothetical protein